MRHGSKRLHDPYIDIASQDHLSALIAFDMTKVS